MNTLETIRDEFLQNVDDSQNLVKSINSFAAGSAATTPLTRGQLELIVGWAFVSVHAAWESFLEDCFLEYLLGAATSSGFAPICCVYPRDRRHALDLVLAGRDYFAWTEPNTVARHSVLYFENGEPFRDILNSTMEDLKEIKTLRNAVAHKSRAAEDKFISLARSKLSVVPLGVSPGGFLLTTKPGSTGRTFLGYYLHKLRIAANKIVPS